MITGKIVLKTLLQLSMFLGLQGENATITVLVEDEKFQVKVTQLKSSCNFQVSVKCLNALIHHDPALNFKQLGKSIFSYKNGQNLGNGVEMYMGYHATVHPGEGFISILFRSIPTFFSSSPLPID
ncbi:hypothetical protein G9A89_011095 [Geosiphon pyriformis]|nr:hypothetical protein G9A89_011095 [Geosiphon pyriformis]